MAVGDVYRLTCLATVLGSTQMNTYAFRMKSTPDPVVSDVVTLANATRDISKAQQSNKVTWTNYSFTQLWGSGMTTIQDECRRDGAKVVIGNFSGTNNGGQASGDLLPPQSAMVATIGTGIAGRRRRGRTYLFGFIENAQTDGSWTTAHMGFLTTALNTYMALYGPTGTDPQFQLGVWSERTASGCWYNPANGQYTNVETPNPDAAFTAATGYNLRNIVYTQRRRTLGVGR